MLSVLDRYCFDAAPVSCERYGNGHINQTYLVVCGDGHQYILQRISTQAFHDVPALMENIRLVTAHLAQKSSDPRSVLTLVPARDGSVYVEEDGGCWRVYEFVTGSLCLERAETPADFAQSAVAFGQFQHLMSDFPAASLSETIPRFHDTPNRFLNLKKAMAEDPLGRLREVSREADFIMEREAFTHILMDGVASGALPLRVTHNDTKINNVLFDQATRKALCVIDLDTVMPGLACNDFGDSIRFGASTAAEDERDLSRVSMDLKLYAAYAEGFLSACGQALTGDELRSMAVGAKMMTLECGLRFLTDYLMGDVYFHIASPDHNLIRCRTQLKLVSDMEQKWDDMHKIIREAAI